ncbi:MULTISPECIES: hypothetical protein [Alphaproteobacteria]|uniref:PepSY domain-containing protein n=2 Tax=Alphaproteobacteria TaxID=28211 RepID=A0A512HPA2_9HYPH|nr:MULTISPECIES: hypothetical protein [Alphaproteobacteria]GEO87283.1 hypothetical protein RNA01_42150 [Ciceribacter naphthalenivorans]GLR23727.1 hypothetical protein GCM10007920_35190 [Ciceribacter naphthalenivorans]GLT06583.1 hypothetical protein GCM10007926_35190 [Sphingomonas psychrolutea]
MKNSLMRAMLFTAILAFPAAAFAEEVPAGKRQAIQDMLKAMQCEVDPANIEADGDGFELDDVFCADGQYDMDLNADLTIAEKRKE